MGDLWGAVQNMYLKKSVPSSQYVLIAFFFFEGRIVLEAGLEA